MIQRHSLQVGVGQRIKSPEDLGGLPIIRDAGQVYSWNLRLHPSGSDGAVLGDGPTFSDGSLCLDAAIAGQGVFLTWEILAADALKRDRLVAPLPGRYATGSSYWLVTGRHARKSRRVKLFERWLRAELDHSLRPDGTPAG